jgi:hypothetical protein
MPTGADDPSVQLEEALLSIAQPPAEVPSEQFTALPDPFEQSAAILSILLSFVSTGFVHLIFSVISSPSSCAPYKALANPTYLS